jgi:hypothetical protein
MIVLYTTFLLVLGVVHLLMLRRAKSLEKKFSRVSLATTRLANQPLLRHGNSGRAELCLAAKQQFDLGRLVHQRDRIETKYYHWQRVADRFGRFVKAARQWKGSKLPYTFGVVDVSMVLYAVDRFGLGQIDLSHLVEMAQSVLTR